MAQQRTYYVYIMASKSRVLYIGVTGFLMQRVLQHHARRRRRVHTPLPRPSSGVFPKLSQRRRRDCTRNGTEEMAPREEDRVDRRTQSDLGGPGGRLGRASRDARGKDSRFLPSVGMTTPKPLSFRNGVAVEESAVACSATVLATSRFLPSVGMTILSGTRLLGISPERSCHLADTLRPVTKVPTLLGLCIQTLIPHHIED